MEQIITTDFYDLYQQETDLEILKTLMLHIQHKSFFDIGAEKGFFTKWMSSLGFKGVFFEPLPKFAYELNALARSTGCIFLPYAVDHRDSTADFYAAYDKTGNPVDYFS